MHHHHPVADPLDVAEEVGRDQHVDPELAPDAGDQVEHVLAALGVHAVGRLVQQQEARVVDQGHGQLDPLLHAGGEPADGPVALLVQADLVADLGRPLAGRPGRQAAELGHEGDEVGGGHVPGQAGPLRQVADLGPDGQRVQGHVVPEHHGPAPVGHEQPQQQLDQGRLPGPVGAHQPGAAGLDGHVDAVERLHGPVPLAQAFDLRDQHSGATSARMGTMGPRHLLTPDGIERRAAGGSAIGRFRRDQGRGRRDEGMAPV